MKLVSDGMTKGMQEFEQPEHEGVTQTWSVVQQEFKCCGVKHYQDWSQTPFGNSSQDVPDSCCLQMADGCGKGLAGQSWDVAKNTIYTNGCLTKFELFIMANSNMAASVGIGIAIFLVLGVLVTCCIARKIENESDYMYVQSEIGEKNYVRNIVVVQFEFPALFNAWVFHF